jgi:hypothetical protein
MSDATGIFWCGFIAGAIFGAWGVTLAYLVWQAKKRNEP